MDRYHDPSKGESRHDTKSPLLRLSPAIRRQIYLEAGLNTGQRIHLDYGVLEQHSHTDSFLRRSFYNLLLICRSIYAETSHIIYSENSFIVHQGDKRNLQLLRNLTTESMFALRTLTVLLNDAPCCLDGCCGRYTDVYRIPCMDRGRKKSLVSSISRHQELIEDWRRTAKYITAHAKSFSLELYLIADVHDHETALYVVDPILRFAKLKHCAIRLGHDSDPTLEEIARNAALRATGRQLDESGLGFRFLNLPPEIRSQVLQYTDLVTPIKEVMWNPKNGYSVCYCISTFDKEALAFFDENSAIGHSFKFRNCWATSGVGCFCRRFHAVSSSSLCNCWSPPRSLFLVCRDFLQSAREVFFSQNRFIITSSKGPNGLAESTPERLEASVWLKNIVPFISLRWLRSVELVFPPFEGDYLRATDPAYGDLLQTIEHVEKELCIRMIDLHIHMADPETDNGSVVGAPTYRPNLEKEQSQKVIAMYVRTLKTLPPLNRFRRFTMHLAVPWGWDETGYHRSKRSHETMQAHEKKRMHIQEMVGRSIVGGNNIDQVLINSNRRSDSQWVESTWTKYEQTIG